jgi:hypothetical protein
MGPDSLLRLCAAQCGEPQFVANQTIVPPPGRNEDCYAFQPSIATPIPCYYFCRICDRVRRLDVIGVMSRPLGIPRFREALVAVSSSKHGVLEQEGARHTQCQGIWSTPVTLRRRRVACWRGSCGRQKTEVGKSERVEQTRQDCVCQPDGGSQGGRTVVSDQLINYIGRWGRGRAPSTMSHFYPAWHV